MTKGNAADVSDVILYNKNWFCTQMHLYIRLGTWYIGQLIAKHRPRNMKVKRLLQDLNYLETSAFFKNID